jgi:N-acyl-D-amino-acid deacylase
LLSSSFPLRPYTLILSVLFSVTVACGDGSQAREETDLLLLGGTVYDGTGGDPFMADVVVRGERIAFVGDAAEAGLEARDTIDAAGLMVTPGFIDMHSHAELDEEWGRDARPFLHQGITLAILGMDGGGTNEISEQFRRWTRNGIGINAMTFVGHNSARRAVMGTDDRAPTEAEMDDMRAYVRRGMEEGALGLSSGLFYVPGSYATTEEVIELNRVAAEYGGIYDTHDRDLGAAYQGIGAFASIEEAIRIGEAAGTPVIFSHFNLQGAHNYGRAEEAARLVEEARARGVEVVGAQHVYTATQASLQAYAIPRWASAGGQEAMIRRFDHPDTVRILDRQTMEMLEIRGGAEKIRIVAPRPDLRGRTLAQVAEEWNLPVPETVRRILRDGNVPVMNLDLYDDWNTRYLARMPWMMTCTDGRTPRPDQPIAHPRPFGAFTKKLRDYVLDDDVISMPFAIRSMTGLAADFLRLPDRGYVREGMVADLAVLARDRIRDRATYDEPQLLSEGTVHVLVNGRFALRDGELTGVLAGVPILRGGGVFREGPTPSSEQVARSSGGMVVSAKPLATDVGAQVLSEGGNAVDAAVATAFALTVVEPSMSSIGGRTQILIRTRDGEFIGVDGGTEVVAGFDPNRMPPAPDPSMGYGTVAVPGTVAALAGALEAYGTWPLSRVLAPAIALAEYGFEVSPAQAERWAGAAPHFALYPGSAAHFLRANGSPWKAGERFRQPALARTLRTLAREGASAFYEGPMAAAIAQDISENGGFVTAEAMGTYRVRPALVARGSYRGHEVVGTYLPASGATVTQILQTLEAFDELEPAVDLGAVVGTAEWVQLLALALRIGFRDRLEHGGDHPGHLRRITSREWALEGAREMVEARKTASHPGGEAGTALAWLVLDEEALEPAHTTHLSVADGRGGMVALTQSIGPAFGSHVAHPELGFLYASTQGYLVSEPGVRPMSSMAPLLLLRDGEPAYVLGGAGARRIVSAMAAVISRAVDGGAPLDEAFRAPRFHALDGDEVRLEDRSEAAWSREEREKLQGLGAAVSTSAAPGYFARLHAIQRDPATGEYVGVADPRGAGAAAGPR